LEFGIDYNLCSVYILLDIISSPRVISLAQVINMTDNKKGISERHKPDIAKSLFTGAIIGMFAVIGTFVGNFWWWFQSEHPKSRLVYNHYNSNI